LLACCRERREAEVRELEKREREREAKMERERLEKQRAAEQAVHKHFEESLRLAQQKVSQVLLLIFVPIFLPVNRLRIVYLSFLTSNPCSLVLVFFFIPRKKENISK